MMFLNSTKPKIRNITHFTYVIHSCRHRHGRTELQLIHENQVRKTFIDIEPPTR